MYKRAQLQSHLAHKNASQPTSLSQQYHSILHTMILPKISFYILLLSVAFAQISAAPVTSDSDCTATNRSLSDDADDIALHASNPCAGF
ncbi:hypothetical protein C8R48DRAFT_711441 [Suillus tomentosus]|nr:hypothetical protein C8R48DRAFT_711441 [Suillus tomentosus]